MSPLINIRRTTARPSALSYFVVRVIATTALASISFAVAPNLLAQSDDSQQSSQDVAEAARQARARKQQNAARAHVYTNEDLRRGKILTSEDQSRAEAANHKNSSAPAPAAPPDVQALDANSATPQEPLGDVARRYRNAKKISPFHLPSSQAELAAPKIVAPLVEPNSNSLLQPHPKNFVPARPVAPLSHRVVPNAPSLPSSRMGRINPFVGRRTEPAPPAVMTIRPVEPRVTPQPRSFTASLPHTSSPPTATLIVVRPGDTLWTLSRQHLGRGTRWLELLAANPAVEDPSRLVPGTQLVLPARATSHRHSAQTITIQAGDSLSKLALAAYGHASYWPCLASANPSLTNPHQLHVGQSIAVPASCTP
jgi:nucleoid-associated protein YgaU